MAEFVRARSTEQKQSRMNEIMRTTDALFQKHTYHEITLTTIAQALGWSRGNLYKYVTTKEEIFLELYHQKQKEYFSDIESVFSDREEPMSDEEFATLWTNILDQHHDYLKYYGILSTIIETNVTVERLAEFKRTVLSGFGPIVQILAKHCGNLAEEQATYLFWTLLFHACGLNNSCHMHPIVAEAMRLAGFPESQYDFKRDFHKFMVMCLRQYH